MPGRPKRGGERAWYRLRWQILERDGFTCQYCGQHAPNVVLEVDHRVAVADSGTDDEENLVAACRACNIGKEAFRAYAVLRGVRSEPASGLAKLDSLTAKIRRVLDERPDATPREIAEQLACREGSARRIKHRILRAVS